MIEINHHRYSFPKLLTLGFLAVIAVGTVLLLLPFATRPGSQTGVMTALFTSTSATCVTGLTLVDTATHWTPFGQLVIALLMEIGGLGFMTFAVMTSLLIRRRLKMSTRFLVQESLNLDNVSQIQVVTLIIKLSLLIQLLGTALLYADFGPRYGWGKGLWYSFFHSISAFCNGGFDLFGNSLANFRTDPYLLVIFAVLIIAGSFGFLVWQDLLQFKKAHRMSLHTHLALKTGATIMVLSVIVYLITEKNLSQFDGQMGWGMRLVNSIFMAITPRTAGLTTFSYTDLSAAGLSYTMLLMFIGGTPGSTAGGIKTTTIGLLTLQAVATLRGHRDPTLAHRRFRQDNVFRALTLLFVALIIIAVAILILAETQVLPERNPLTYLTFEVMAAFGTTGISLGVTAKLNLLGKLVIMALMFIGRVGIYTVMFSIFNAQPKQPSYRYPEEGVLIG